MFTTIEKIETGCKLCGGCVRPEDFDLGLCLDCDEIESEEEAEMADTNEVTCNWCDANTTKDKALWLGDEAEHVCRPCIEKVEEEAREARGAYYRSEEARLDFWESAPVGPEGEALF